MAAGLYFHVNLPGPKMLLLFYCLEFDELILKKIVRIVATRCQIFRLKCTTFNFGLGSAPDPAEGAYSAPQTL